ncbi:Hypothetical predicted protein [Podarcis lilfordi]|uniref:Uncharacterized protein n=1 Tax=Podarcis lilfordi TaxID=74358 RepID=A0AA35KCX1_9SAUR|nr:Hypothetical predicted protein [Podarcis lilfordi]
MKATRYSIQYCIDKADVQQRAVVSPGLDSRERKEEACLGCRPSSPRSASARLNGHGFGRCDEASPGTNSLSLSLSRLAGAAPSWNIERSHDANSQQY